VTNKTGVQTISEFKAGYTPRYAPLYPLLLPRSRQHVAEVGEQNFKQATTVGDIRARRFNPKDTELKQVAVGQGSKAFKKYFFANQYIISTMQSQEGTSDVVAQVLDEHQKHNDDLTLTGDSGVNNGLYTSSDPNYTLKDSVEIDSTSRLYDLHGKVIETATEADKLSGPKILLFYGNVLPYYRGLFSGSDKPFATVLAESLGEDYSVKAMPSEITPSGAHGWMIINTNNVMYHYMTLPKLDDQGTNAEKKYNWFNFLMGSSMVDVEAPGAIIRQPTTLEA